MDSIYSRLNLTDTANNLNWKASITPHDNYSFTDRLYYESLSNNLSEVVYNIIEKKELGIW